MSSKSALTTKVTGNHCDLSKALKLRIINGLSYEEIGKLTGTSKQAVHQALKPFLEMLQNPDAIQTYRDNRALLFDAAAVQLLQHAIDEAKLKQTGPGTLIRALSELFKMARLETGESTENIAQKVEIVSDETREKLDRLLGKT